MASPKIPSAKLLARRAAKVQLHYAALDAINRAAVDGLFEDRDASPDRGRRAHGRGRGFPRGQPGLGPGGFPGAGFWKAANGCYY
jgi:hypothetical protein